MQLVLVMIFGAKQRNKGVGRYQTVYSEAVSRKRKDNTMIKRKRTNNDLRNTTQKTHSLVPFIEGCGGYYLTLLKIGTPLLPFQGPGGSMS